MKNLNEIFAEALGVPLFDVSDDLAYNSIPQWDSTAHMGLIAMIEDTYGIFMDTDDIIDLGSVSKAKEILKKYGVEL